MDGSGKPNGMQEWLSAPLPYRRQVNYPGYGFIAGGRLRGEPAPGWTNHVYKARVLAVQVCASESYILFTPRATELQQFVLAHNDDPTNEKYYSLIHLDTCLFAQIVIHFRRLISL